MKHFKFLVSLMMTIMLISFTATSVKAELPTGDETVFRTEQTVHISPAVEIAILQNQELQIETGTNFKAEQYVTNLKQYKEVDNFGEVNSNKLRSFPLLKYRSIHTTSKINITWLKNITAPPSIRRS